MWMLERKEGQPGEFHAKGRDVYVERVHGGCARNPA
jgi:hypothetical protein